ncbi:DUF2076 domain-containing protein [Agrobacterium pusense]|jgi:hypothetical protein|uniref:DUF2076 domain-containing protein n=1 Tax=Agrobacterium pusense TaxID=648995 RepID=UPI000891CB43|nr:DUF2076 domain-containing protein [Agrobacterium pusense]TGR70997.1 DUF2076 domain-containing protein [bacterium M00.F.Ca.ET.194.01.1.1]TGS55849.1 DUF2076 domain-containing protein [bacterium M00.F.Ca.ET.179.01.1.1]TGV48758.1 DUF2076 domain-containing protein [bacterium M00.F.Ca.ET.168.01.1.1]MBW9058198.1 DUF2076 domain-containing protein [Agrobacterium pusense]OOO17301.1 ABC transporter substrate-binding protein [Agrobacterium pusense]
MSPEESQLLKGLFERTKAASATPRDREAETLIADAVRDQPAAPYYLAQAVIVQEKGLEAAAAHIKQLEERIHALESANPAPQAAAQGGFLSSIFGTGQPQPPAPTPAPAAAAPASWRNDTAGQTAGPWGSQAAQQQPGGPWGQQPAAAGRSGGGFLQGALGTAAGVAGGMLLANSLSGIFGSHMSSLGLGSPFGGNSGTGNAPVEETVINNYYGDMANPQDNNDDDIQQADYDDSADDADFDSGDDSSFV